MENTPARLGIKKFLDRYLSVAEDRFNKYFPGQWDFTKRLEALGNKIFKKTIADDATLLLFLIDVAVWKEPHEPKAQEMIGLVTSNTYGEIKSVFNKVWSALAEHKDKETIDAIGTLSGFGRRDGSRKIASAVLRFLDPSRFAVVDYRNWFLLSNTEGRYFDQPLLEPLAPTIEDTKRKPINTMKYLEYLQVVRQLARENGTSPAEVDIALFAFSDEIKPLSIALLSDHTIDNERGEKSKDTYLAVKHQKMVEILMRVVNDNKSKGHAKTAIKLENELKKCKTPREIMNMCYNMTTRAAYMDRRLAMSGALTLSHVMKELTRIYNE